jgi:hypothetical protein
MEVDLVPTTTKEDEKLLELSSWEALGRKHHLLAHEEIDLIERILPLPVLLLMH